MEEFETPSPYTDEPWPDTTPRRPPGEIEVEGVWVEEDIGGRWKCEHEEVFRWASEEIAAMHCLNNHEAI